MEEKPSNLSQIDTALPSSGEQREKQKNPFKAATIICAILALAGLGFGVYKMIEPSRNKCNVSPQDESDNKSDSSSTATSETDKTATTDSDESIVITALEKEQSTPWPEDMPRMENEPETLVNRVKIPKINLNAPAAIEVNQKILDRYSRYVDGEQTYTKGPYSAAVTYDYAIRDKILFVIIKSIALSYRASGSAEYDVYYYDTATNQELTVTDVATRFGITRSDANIILPSVADSFDVFYRDQNYCYAPGCTIIENTY